MRESSGVMGSPVIPCIAEPDGSPARYPFDELTDDLLHGVRPALPGESGDVFGNSDPRWVWFVDHPKSPASPCGTELLGKFGLSGAEPLKFRLPDVERFILEGRWDGLGLDPRFMSDTAHYCDHLMPAARATGCANILVRETDGTVTGDFTIGTGLLNMLPAMGLPIEETRALFLADAELMPLAVGLSRLLEALGAPAARIVKIDAPLTVEEALRIDCCSSTTLLFNASNFGRFPVPNLYCLKGKVPRKP